MNDFIEDDVWQRRQRDNLLIPGFYRQYYGDEFRLADNDKELQSRGIDTIIEKIGKTVDEKIVRWPGFKYHAFALETRSCTVPGHEKSGWMLYGEADWLLYCFQQQDESLDCYLIDFPMLQKWFWPLESTFPPFQMKTKNCSAGRVVNIDLVVSAVPTKRFQIEKLDDHTQSYAA